MECNPLSPKAFCHFSLLFFYVHFHVSCVFVIVCFTVKGKKNHHGICFKDLERGHLKSCIIACNRAISGTGFDSFLYYYT